MADDKAFLGTGMKFPPQINPITGRIEVSTAEKSVKESVYLILTTRKTERLVRPWFGSQIDSYVFMDISATRIHMMTRDIAENILEQEPRVSDVDVSVSPESGDGRLIINVAYTVTATNTRDNLVFPYYLDMDEEIEPEAEYAEQEEFDENTDGEAD